jgi:Holliday junction resolvase RusA-like endonuclease
MKRPCVLRYRAFADKVRLHRVKLPQPCRVVFHIAMPKSWAEIARRRLDGKPHSQKPDLDNLVKALWDALHARDEVLWRVDAEKRWTRGAARIEVVQTPDTPDTPDACRVCGCTEDDCSQCVEKTGEPCTWVAPGLCSACETPPALAHGAHSAQATRSGAGTPRTTKGKHHMARTTRNVRPKARAAAAPKPKKTKGRAVAGKGKGKAKPKARPRKARGAAAIAEV